MVFVFFNLKLTNCIYCACFCKVELQTLYVLVELLVERMAGHGGG